jgi:hypothetical protein
MAPNMCHAVGKDVLCPCKTLYQPSTIAVIFDTNQQWWKDPPTYQQSAMSEHLTRNTQSEYSNMTGVPSSAQKCDIVCWLGQYFCVEITAHKHKYM